MNCNRVQEHLSAFIDGELESSLVPAVKAHLIRCSACRGEKEQLEAFGASIRTIPPVTAPPDFRDRIYASIHTRTQPKPSPFLQWKMILAPAAAMIFGIIIGAYRFQSFAPLQLAADSPVLDTSQPISDTAVSESNIVTSDDGVREYTIDRYLAMPVEAIVQTPIPESDGKLHPVDENNPPNLVPRSRVILDRIPLKAAYDRVVY